MLLDAKFTVGASTPIPTLKVCVPVEALVKPVARLIPPPSAALNVRLLDAPDSIVKEFTAKNTPFTVMVVLLLWPIKILFRVPLGH